MDAIYSSYVDSEFLVPCFVLQPSAAAQKSKPFYRGHFSYVDSGFLILCYVLQLSAVEKSHSTMDIGALMILDFPSFSAVAQKCKPFYCGHCCTVGSEFHIVSRLPLLWHRNVSHSTVGIAVLSVLGSLFRFFFSSSHLFQL